MTKDCVFQRKIKFGVIYVFRKYIGDIIPLDALNSIVIGLKQFEPRWYPMTNWGRAGALLLLVLCFYGTRLPVVRRAVTADEARWLLRSGNFYQALSSGNLKPFFKPRIKNKTDLPI